MTPILGIMASSISGSKAVTTAYESIATVTIGVTASAITFSSIPQTYTHLQVRGIGRAGGGAAADYNGINLQVNGDTGSNYKTHQLYGDGATAGASAQGSTNLTYTGVATGQNNTASVFSATIVDILDYTNTNKYTTLRALSGTDSNNTYGYLQLGSGLWLNTAAVTSLTFQISTVGFGQYSSFALYGIKGA
jgi:hypothetical protein